MTAPEESPLIQPDQCGHTRVTGRFEWKCIAAPHSVGDNRAVPFHSQPVQVIHAHRFVNRWGEGVERPQECPVSPDA